MTATKEISSGLQLRHPPSVSMQNVATELAYHADEEAYLGNYPLAPQTVRPGRRSREY